jgi:hypothetical protein
LFFQRDHLDLASSSRAFCLASKHEHETSVVSSSKHSMLKGISLLQRFLSNDRFSAWELTCVRLNFIIWKGRGEKKESLRIGAISLEVVEYMGQE